MDHAAAGSERILLLTHNASFHKWDFRKSGTGAVSLPQGRRLALALLSVLIFWTIFLAGVYGLAPTKTLMGVWPFHPPSIAVGKFPWSYCGAFVVDMPLALSASTKASAAFTTSLGAPFSVLTKTPGTDPPIANPQSSSVQSACVNIATTLSTACVISGVPPQIARLYVFEPNWRRADAMSACCFGVKSRHAKMASAALALARAPDAVAIAFPDFSSALSAFIPASLALPSANSALPSADCALTSKEPIICADSVSFLWPYGYAAISAKTATAKKQSASFSSDLSFALSSGGWPTFAGTTTTEDAPPLPLLQRWAAMPPVAKGF